jgi:hypothetical protein
MDFQLTTGKLDREPTEIDHCPRRWQEIHADNAADLKAVIHLSNLELETVDTVVTHSEAVDVSCEHVLVPTHAAQSAKRICRTDVNACVCGEIRINNRTRRSSIDQHISDLDRFSGVREGCCHEGQIMPKGQ